MEKEEAERSGGGEKTTRGQEMGHQDKVRGGEAVQPNLKQCHPIELSAMREMFHICAV